MGAMQPLLTATQHELVTLAQHVAAQFGERAAVHDSEASFPFENFAELHRTGYLALTLPVGVGGRGISLYAFCLVQEQLAQGCGATALAANMHLYNCGGALGSFTETFRRRVVDTILSDGAVIG